MTVRSEKAWDFIGTIIEYATKREDRRLKDFWYLSDYIAGMNKDLSKVIKILDGLDNTKDAVKEFRRELNL